MCTAISFDGYFGRTLDYEFSFGQQVVITPRYYPLPMRCLSEMDNHYAIIGTARVEDGYPLYFDACNEKGLAMAGLNFPGNAHYFECRKNRDNVASFELIPWILGQCSNVKQAVNLMQTINLVNISFSKELPLSPLHWMIGDKDKSVVVECVRDGLHIYDNPIGVLTNNPPFEMQLFHLSNYMGLHSGEAVDRMGYDLKLHSRGMGAFGLPGDLSSPSRFVRAAFTRSNATVGKTDSCRVHQFFHILATVSMTEGCVRLETGNEKTIYTSCCDLSCGIYYYTTYDNCRITAVALKEESLNEKKLICFPFRDGGDIFCEKIL